MKSLFELAIHNISLDKRPRTGKPWTGIVIHHTGLPSELPKDISAWRKYTASMAAWLSKKDDAYVSAHFLIGRSGEIYLLVDPRTHVAFHAGESSYWNSYERIWKKGCNEFMIGIELAGDGNRVDYSDEQYASLAYTIKELMLEFPTISPHALTGHECVSPARKQDPGAKFKWRYLFSLIYQGG